VLLLGNTGCHLGFYKKMLKEYSAGAVIFRRVAGQILFLILHYEEGHWAASKGHLEKGENLEQTALREIREETGITDIRWIPGFKVEISYDQNKSGQLSHKFVTFFLAETRSQEVRLSVEHMEYAWLPFAKCYAKVTHESEKEVWQSAHDYLSKMQPI
jgi:bis(5'-nucleosidyl)-tetraphosphatase